MAQTGVIRVADVEDARKIWEFTSKPANTFGSPGTLESVLRLVVKEVPSKRDVDLHGV